MKKHTNQNNSNQQRFPTLFTPPEGYGIVEDGIYRSLSSIQAQNFSFLERLGLRTAVYISSDPLPKVTDTFIKAHQIELVHFDNWSPSDLGEEVMKAALEVLLDTKNHPVLLLESPENAESVLVGCLRRVQTWSLTAIFDEYQAFSRQSQLYDDNEQLIERFDPGLVTFPQNLPVWFEHHLRMLQKEKELSASSEFLSQTTCDDDQSATRNDNSDRNSCEQQNCNVLIDRLPAASYWGPLVSPSCVFSEKLSILDEDDDG